MEHKENQIKVYSQNSTNGLHISAPDVKQAISATNNRAQYYADLAKKYKDDAKKFRDDAFFYSQQNSDVTTEYVDMTKLELKNEIKDECAKVKNDIVDQLPQNVSELNNDVPYINKTEFDDAVRDLELPPQSGCDGMFLYTDGETESWKEVPPRYNLFDVVIKDYILTFEESHGFALQGTYVYKEALAGSHYGYPDFYAKCLEEYQEATGLETVNGATVKVHSNGHKFYDIADKNAIDDFFNTFGSAWFYGVDIENECIFLPRNNYFEQLTCNISEVGKSIEAGLPNITGTINQYFTAGGGDADGSFLLKNYTKYYAVSGGGNQGLNTLTFDASRSNPIYGNSDTVQPNAVKKLLYICVGNTISSQAMINVVNQGLEILEQVNQGIEGRIKLDGSNAQFPYLVETYQNGTSWYRIWSDGWCEQGGSVESIIASPTVSFLIPFKDDYYKILISQGGNASPALGFTNQSRNGFLWTTYSGDRKAVWEAKGYIR